MAISPLWCSRMSVCLFYTLMMEEMHQHSCVGTLVVVNGNVNQYSYIDLMGGAVLESVEFRSVNV